MTADLTAPGHARRLLNQVLPEFTRSEREVAALLISEIVTNAVAHGSGPVRVTVEMGSAGVRVSVHDDSTQPPSLVRARAFSEGGRGLHIVEAFAEAWGVEPDRDPLTGKTVWFCVRGAMAAAS